MSEQHRVSDKPCELIARLPNNRKGRAALAAFREGVNRKRYRLRVLFSGPREGFATHKEDAHTFRLYLDDLAARETRSKYANALDEWMNKCYRAQESNTILFRKNDELAAQLEKAREFADGCRSIAKNVMARERAAQQQLNSIPAWILWIIGALRDLRARFTAKETA